MSNLEYQRTASAMPYLKDKLAVSLVSRANSAAELIRFQGEEQGFIKELWGFFTGTTARRQQQVNEHLHQNVQQTIDWLKDITLEVDIGHRAIKEINDSLQAVDGIIVDITNEVMFQRDALRDLKRVTEEKISALDKRLVKIEVKSRAEQELRLALSRWEAGLLDLLTPAQQCYATLQNLFWSDFGYFVTAYPGEESRHLVEELKLACLARLHRVMETSGLERIPRSSWFLQPHAVNMHMQSAVRFFADWSTVKESPYTYSTVNSLIETDIAALPFEFHSQRLVDSLCFEALTELNRQ